MSDVGANDELQIQLDLLRWMARNPAGCIAIAPGGYIDTYDEGTRERAPYEHVSRTVFLAMRAMLEVFDHPHDDQKRRHYHNRTVYYRLRPDLRTTFTGEASTGDVMGLLKEAPPEVVRAFKVLIEWIRGLDR